MSADDDADAIALPLILLVENEPLIREMVVDALESAGFSTMVSSDGQGALDLFAEHRTTTRGLITDINLDDAMDGWGLARAAREQAGDLPVVYVSGACGHEWPSRGVPNSLMISKPFAADLVVGAISSLMHVSALREDR